MKKVNNFNLKTVKTTKFLVTLILIVFLLACSMAIQGNFIQKTAEAAQNQAGQWNLNQSNGYTGTMTLQQNQSGYITGSAIWNGYLQGTISGQISGNNIEFTISYPNGDKGLYKGTLAQNGTRIINGTVKGNNGVSASWDATR